MKLKKKISLRYLLPIIKNPKKWLHHHRLLSLSQQYIEYSNYQKIHLAATKSYYRRRVYFLNGGLLTSLAAFIGIILTSLFSKDFRSCIRPLVILFNEKGFTKIHDPHKQQMYLLIIYLILIGIAILFMIVTITILLKAYAVARERLELLNEISAKLRKDS